MIIVIFILGQHHLNNSSFNLHTNYDDEDSFDECNDDDVRKLICFI